MESDSSRELREAHALLDLLPPAELNAVRGLLQVMVEPLSRSLALAEVEEEEITPETRPRWTKRTRQSSAARDSAPGDPAGVRPKVTTKRIVLWPPRPSCVQSTAISIPGSVGDTPASSTPLSHRSRSGRG
jgi:hypothetical protein